MAKNGLKNFAMHSEDSDGATIMASITGEIESATADSSLKFLPAELDAETVARRYLDQMLVSAEVPSLTVDESSSEHSEFRTLGTETLPLTGTKIVKFRQLYYKIPIYGSLVTVELDEGNTFLAINTAIGEPLDVSPIAGISPSRALNIVRQEAGQGAKISDAPPRLFYYFDAEGDKWRLVYIAENIAKVKRTRKSKSEQTADYHPLPEVYDYVIDAHTGKLVAALPKTKTAAWTSVEEEAPDALGKKRRLRVQRDGSGARRMHDAKYNVQTCDFKFKNVQVQGQSLPGDYVGNPPPPWNAAAVSAHANAADVAAFLVDTLRRRGLDDRGGAIVSSINCLYGISSSDREWRNAAWLPDIRQMVYGQRLVNGALRSYALAKDIVAHEIIHGLIDNTADLDYLGESGALNESYADIFGIIISNTDVPSVRDWNWELGEALDSVNNVPLRDLSDPPRRNHPDHMDDYLVVTPPFNKFNDYGGVHTNSGIHNKTAYNILTAKKSANQYLFTPKEVAALFYIALAQYLAPTSGFIASRRGVELAARTLFRRDPAATRIKKLTAIADAFDAVGIV